jgi:hypothetical protein
MGWRDLSVVRHLLVEWEGGKAYLGWDLVDNSAFKSDEATRMRLVAVFNKLNWGVYRKEP